MYSMDHPVILARIAHSRTSASCCWMPLRLACWLMMASVSVPILSSGNWVSMGFGSRGKSWNN